MSNRGELADLISNMEPGVRDLVRWCRIVEALGTSDSVPSDTLTVMGAAMVHLAQTVEGDWERCFRLAFAKTEACS